MGWKSGIRIDGFDGKPVPEDADFVEFDDLAISGDLIEGVHIECMDKGLYWARIDLKNGRPAVVLHFSTLGKLKATVTRD